jgi:ABC-type nitrate/sulfonate/bicarbonate transport system substrate-binding protein
MSTKLWNKIGRTLLSVALLGWATFVQAADVPIKIRIAYPSGMNGQIPVVMERAGIAKTHGLEAEYDFFQYGPPAMEAFLSGRVDAVITSLMPVTTLLSKRPDSAVVVASLGQSSYALVVPKDSTVGDVRQLKGKKIAVSFGSDSELDLLTLLKASGLSPASNVQLINTPPSELVLALKQKFADAIVIRQPQLTRLKEDFGVKTIHTWPFRFVSIMRTDFLKENPGAKEKYLAALRESILYIAKNKDTASEWFGEKLRLDPKIIRQVSNDDPYYNVTKLDDINIGVTPATLLLLNNWFRNSYENGMIKTPLALDENGIAKILPVGAVK